MKRSLRAVSLCAVLCGFSSSVRAAFRDQGWGVRATGMGGAFTALADDSSALFWNPAGAAWVRRGDVSFAGSRAFPGLTSVNISYGFLSMLLPSRNGAFGVAATSYNADNLMRENIGLLHYSFKLGDSFGAGVNLKYLWHGYNIDQAASASPVFANGTSESAFTADAGLRWKLTDRLAAGVLGRNLTEPDVGLASVDRVPSEYQAGVLFSPLNTLSVELDGSYRHQSTGNFRDKTDYRLGVENWFLKGRRNSFALRGGVNSDQIAGGFSVHVNSWSPYSLRLDYSYIYDTGFNISEAVTHQIGLTLYFTAAPEDTDKAIPAVKPNTKPALSAPSPLVPQNSSRPKAAVPSTGGKAKAPAAPAYRSGSGGARSSGAAVSTPSRKPAPARSAPKAKKKDVPAVSVAPRATNKTAAR